MEHSDICSEKQHLLSNVRTLKYESTNRITSTNLPVASGMFTFVHQEDGSTNSVVVQDSQHDSAREGTAKITEDHEENGHISIPDENVTRSECACLSVSLCDPSSTSHRLMFLVFICILGVGELSIFLVFTNCTWISHEVRILSSYHNT